MTWTGSHGIHVMWRIREQQSLINKLLTIMQVSRDFIF